MTESKQPRNWKLAPWLLPHSIQNGITCVLCWLGIWSWHERFTCFMSLCLVLLATFIIYDALYRYQHNIMKRPFAKRHRPGDVLYQHPLRQLLWTLIYRPSTLTVLLLGQACFSIVTLLMTGTCITHTLQCIAIDEQNETIDCVHTQHGMVVLTKLTTNDPLYQTADILCLCHKWEPHAVVLARSFRQLVGTPMPFSRMLMTPWYRWFEAKQQRNFTPKNPEFRLWNCVHLIMLGWYMAGHPLYLPDGRCTAGLFPLDLLDVI